jgi:integrase/recombinase XerD
VTSRSSRCRVRIIRGNLRLAGVVCMFMTTERYFKHPRAIERFRRGALGVHIDGFAEQMFEQGYARQYGRNKLWLLRELSGWLERKHPGASDLNEERLAEFARERCRRRRPMRGGHRVTLQRFLDYLRNVGAAPRPPSSLPRDAKSRLERAFAEYLRQERGVCRATVDNYLHEVRRFLADRGARRAISPSRIRTKDLNAFVLRRGQKVGPKRAKLTVTALRSFCQFLRFRGDLKCDLSVAVLTAPNWRLTSLPKSLTQNEVRRLLRQCDRRTAAGQRNFAILLTLARLGLRAKEIVLMALDDIDWEAGEIIVRGKGSYQERMPLPRDVGGALASYLRHWRPPCATRRLFVRLKAPYRGFSDSETVSSVVRRALARAGLRPPTTGAHLLRFTLATNLLRCGGSLPEVREILRHRHPDTTALYAKVNLNTLRSVAPRWPGVRR